MRLPDRTTLSTFLAIAALILVAMTVSSGSAQPPGFRGEITPEMRQAFERARGRFRVGTPPGSSPPGSGESKKDDKSDGDKKDDDEEDDEDKKDGEEEEKGPEPVTRPDEPPRPPDPRELEATPDANGRVTFSFHGQPWADVLEWLAEVSGLSLDWRELPGDYLNLSTQRSYTLPEARDLINRHLQARGYTLLLSGEVLSVFKLDQLEPSLVPRVTEEDLYDRQPHDIVKLSLETPPGLEPKQAVEDVKQALSPSAKVLPLAATGRLLMIDTVANLRMVSSLLNAERMAAEGRQAPREFVLRYVQAPSVIDILYVVLGLDPNSRPSQMELRMQQQKLELMQQMAQRGQDVARLMKDDGPPVYLAYNRQRNSVLANAPPEQMRIIERTIDALDVPAGGGDTPPDSATADRTFRSYRLKTIETQAVIGTLRDIGDLSPRAELQGDDSSKTLFARASEGDHAKIEELIEQLDGAETVVEVFWLRRLPAEAVAGSIQSLIINKPQQEEEDNDPWDWRRRRRGGDDDAEEDPATILRVDADIENNRLIVRGTPEQLGEVRELLVKLGEPVGDSPDARRLRVFDAMDPADTRELLDRIESAWPEVGGGAELVLPPEDATDRDDSEEDAEEQDDPPDAAPRTAARAGGASPFRLLAAPGESRPAESKPEDGKKPPIVVRVDPNGRLVVRSENPAALNRFEALMDELAPPPKRYEVFRITNRSPDDIVASLQVYFEEFLAEDNDPQSRFWRRLSGESIDDDPIALSRRRPLRFLADDWSSTILVANATGEQLVEIERLIDAWDRQPIDDRVITRRTATVKLEYAKASNVVSALKEVYRDLLSRGDREFDTAEQKARGSSTRYLTQIRYGDGGATEPAFIGFDGVLSLGSDDEANVVIVSARDEVFGSVLDAIQSLDERARPTTTVRVVSVEGGVAMDEVRAALARALASGGSGAASGSSDGDRDRSRDRERRGRRGR